MLQRHPEARASQNSCGKLFHNFGAASLKECKPYLAVLTLGCSVSEYLKEYDEFLGLMTYN